MGSRRGQGPAEPDWFSTLLTSTRTNTSNPQPPKSRACGHCFIFPTGKQRFSECAKCKSMCYKSMCYCSRDCQKKAWPLHKLVCGAGGKQREFIVKCWTRVSSQKMMADLSLAAAHTLFELLTTSMHPQKMCVVRADLWLRPREDADLGALLFQEIPLGPLLAKQMLGRIMFTGMYYEPEEDPPDPRIQAIWQAKREALDQSGETDTYVVVVCIHFKLTVVNMFAAMVWPEDLDKLKQNRHIEIPMLDWCGSRNPFLHAVNSELAKDDGSSKKMGCVLNDEDKMFVRAVGNAGRNSQCMEECVPELLFRCSKKL